MDSKQMPAILEQYCWNTVLEGSDIKVTRVADRKTVFVEQNGDSGRAIMMSEYKVDGVTYCAG